MLPVEDRVTRLILGFVAFDNANRLASAVLDMSLNQLAELYVIIMLLDH